MMAPTIEDFRNFLQRKSVTSVYLSDGAGDTTNDLAYDKAALLPFYIDAAGAPHFYLAKLAQTDPVRSDPLFQIPKGTREAWWVDAGTGKYKSRTLKPDDVVHLHEEVETLAITALREAEEEAGFDRHNLRKLFDLGPVSFASESHPGQRKKMWMFAAEVKNKDNFSAPAGISVNSEGKKSAGTERCGWFHLDRENHVLPDNPQERVRVRIDHAELIKRFVAKLKDKQHSFRDNPPVRTLLSR